MSLEEYWDCTMLALSHEGGKGHSLLLMMGETLHFLSTRDSNLRMAVTG